MSPSEHRPGRANSASAAWFGLRAHLSRSGRSLASIALVLFVLGACAAPQPTRFYALSSAGTVEPSADEATAKLVVGLGPVSVPSYLDRPEIVTRAGTNRLILADLDKWSEPLSVALTRQLREKLVAELGSQQVLILPASFDIALSYRIALEIVRFDADSAGNTVLESRWRLFDRRGERLIRTEFSEIVVQSEPPPEFEAIVASMSEALGRLGAELADAVADAARR